MIRSFRRLSTTVVVAAIFCLVGAAPQKRSCHFSPFSESSYTIDTAPSVQGLTSTTSTFIASTLTPEVILIYPDTTYTLPSTISLSIPLPTTLPQKTPAAFNNGFPSASSHASINNTTATTKATTTITAITTTTTTTTSSSPTHTLSTPSIDAMQTAYYTSVCGWPQHADDAICLGGNTMMCCRADNGHCQAILMDGGLSCQGIESGDWATTWTRPTVTLGVDGKVIPTSTTAGSSSSSANLLVEIGDGTKTATVGVETQTDMGLTEITTEAMMTMTTTTTITGMTTTTMTVTRTPKSSSNVEDDTTTLLSNVKDTATRPGGIATSARTGFNIDSAAVAGTTTTAITTTTDHPIPDPVLVPTDTDTDVDTATDMSMSTSTSNASTNTDPTAAPLITIIPVERQSHSLDVPSST